MSGDRFFISTLYSSLRRKFLIRKFIFLNAKPRIKIKHRRYKKNKPTAREQFSDGEDVTKQENFKIEETTNVLSHPNMK